MPAGADAGGSFCIVRRGLRRAVQRHVEDPLAEELIRGRLPLGGVEVYVDGGRLAYRPAARSESGQRLAQNV